MSNFIGMNPSSVYDAVENQFLYGFRRTDQGELFMGKIDQISKDDSITINNPGDPLNNFTNFQEGQDFFEGRDTNHELVYKNLNYEQLRWDSKNLYYYVNAEGELVVSVNKKHNYKDTDSSDGTTTSSFTNSIV